MRDLSNPAGIFFATLLVLVGTSLSDGQQPVASFYYDESGNVISQAQDTNGDGKVDRAIF